MKHGRVKKNVQARDRVHLIQDASPLAIDLAEEGFGRPHISMRTRTTVWVKIGGCDVPQVQVKVVAAREVTRKRREGRFESDVVADFMIWERMTTTPKK